MNIKIIQFPFVFLLLSSKVLAFDNMTQLQQLVSKANYQQAWQQAQRLSKANEGDPRFDYLYGISALETGHPDKAVFALERVIINQPNLVRPRLELARAYLKVHNDQAALREFKQVLSLNPPATVQYNVNRYIQAMSKSSKSNKQWILDGLLTLAAGYDDNANFGADTVNFNVPVFGSIILKDESLKKDSPFIEIGAQLKYRYVLSDAHRVFLNTRVGHKHFSKAKKFNLSNLSIQGGSLFDVGKLQYQISLRHQTLRLNDHPFSNTLGLEAGVARELSNDRVVAASMAVENYDHKKQNLRDARRYQASARYGFTNANVNHQVEILLGTETPKHSAGKYHSRNSMGVAYTTKRAWDARHSSSFSMQLQRYTHRDKDPIYNVKRKDKRLLVKVGHSINLSKKLSAFADIGYIKNNSNLDLYKTNKTFARVGINYQF